MEPDPVEYLLDTLRGIMRECENSQGQPRPSRKKIWHDANFAMTHVIIQRAAIRAGEERRS
jgi:hypothetical protein